VKRVFSLLLISIALSGVAFNSVASAQTRRSSKRTARSSPSSSYADKQKAEIQAGRERIATQIKTLSQFLYLLAGISKGIETAEAANRGSDSNLAMPSDQIERNKARVKDSIKNVRVGLEQLETSFRSNPALTSYYSNVSGLVKIAQNAEGQAAANHFDEAGRSLIKAVNQLTDALVALR